MKRLILLFVLAILTACSSDDSNEAPPVINIDGTPFSLDINEDSNIVPTELSTIGGEAYYKTEFSIFGTLGEEAYPFSLRLELYHEQEDVQGTYISQSEGGSRFYSDERFNWQVPCDEADPSDIPDETCGRLGGSFQSGTVKVDRVETNLYQFEIDAITEDDRVIKTSIRYRFSVIGD